MQSQRSSYSQVDPSPQLGPPQLHWALVHWVLVCSRFHLTRKTGERGVIGCDTECPCCQQWRNNYDEDAQPYQEAAFEQSAWKEDDSGEGEGLKAEILEFFRSDEGRLVAQTQADQSIHQLEVREWVYGFPQHQQEQTASQQGAAGVWITPDPYSVSQTQCNNQPRRKEKYRIPLQSPFWTVFSRQETTSTLRDYEGKGRVASSGSNRPWVHARLHEKTGPDSPSKQVPTQGPDKFPSFPAYE